MVFHLPLLVLDGVAVEVRDTPGERRELGGLCHVCVVSYSGCHFPDPGPCMKMGVLYPAVRRCRKTFLNFLLGPSLRPQRALDLDLVCSCAFNPARVLRGSN